MKSKEALRKPYKMRRNVCGRNSFTVTMPFEVIEREARKRHLDIDTFIKTYQVVAEYNSFDGVHYTFEKVEDNNK